MNPSLSTLADEWANLHRWEKAELGRALRRQGLSYGEIRQIIPAPKGTLSNWCREIQLTTDQVMHLKQRTQGQAGLPRNTQWRRRQEVAELRSQAVRDAPNLLSEPLWLAGVSLYWAEGSKTTRLLEMTNADPRLLRLFMRWTRRYLVPTPEYVLALHLHHGNDDEAVQRHWASQLELTDPDFHKSFIKPKGTGHRKKVLRHGVCRVRLRRGADAHIITMAWIDWLSIEVDAATLISPTGR